MCEDAPCCGCCGQAPDTSFHDTQADIERDQEKFLIEAQEIREADMARGWPGDGSGEDDLADLMAHGDEGCYDMPGEDY